MPERKAHISPSVWSFIAIEKSVEGFADIPPPTRELWPPHDPKASVTRSVVTSSSKTERMPSRQF
jgi:hypothetical protein